MEAYTTTLGFFSEASLIVIVLLLFFAFIVLVWWLGRAITYADQKRDEYNSKRDDDSAKLIKAQIQIMNTQQAEFGKLNTVIIESLKDKNALLQQNSKTNADLASAINNLGRIFDMGQNETNETLSRMLDYLTISKGQDSITHEKLSQILDHLQSEKQHTLLITGIVEKLAKELSEMDACDKDLCLEWKKALDERLQSLDVRIDIILEGIRNEETPNRTSNPT